MNVELRLLQGHSLTSLLRLEIEKLVLSGHFAPGERLNESALAARFSVSRGPVREACRALSEKGLLELVPNRGVFMRRISEAEAQELYDVRAGLFGAAAHLLAAKITSVQLAALEELIVAMDRGAGGDGLDEYYAANLRFHTAILEFAGNRRLQEDYEKVVKELHLFRERALVHGGGLAASNKEHRLIVAALRAANAPAAMNAAFTHVMNGKKRMALPPGAPDRSPAQGS